MPVCAVRRAVISTPPSASSDVCIFNMLWPNLSSHQFAIVSSCIFSVRGALSHLAFFCALLYHLVKQISLSEPHRLKVTTYGDWPIGYDGKRSYLPLWKGEGCILKNLPPSEVGAVFVWGLAIRPWYTFSQTYIGSVARDLPSSFLSSPMGGRQASPSFF